MEKKLRILLLVAEPLRADDGGGNTAINFFSGMNAEFAQIYCSELAPENSLCDHYYRFTEKEAIRNFFSRREVGQQVFITKGIGQKKYVAKPEITRSEEHTF